ncbi:hypothetical protein ISCGN_026507 [Ixodes scapularis]
MKRLSREYHWSGEVETLEFLALLCSTTSRAILSVLPNPDACWWRLGCPLPAGCRALATLRPSSCPDCKAVPLPGVAQGNTLCSRRSEVAASS